MPGNWITNEDHMQSASSSTAAGRAQSGIRVCFEYLWIATFLVANLKLKHLAATCYQQTRVRGSLATLPIGHLSVTCDPTPLKPETRSLATLPLFTAPTTQNYTWSLATLPTTTRENTTRSLATLPTQIGRVTSDH